MIFDTPENILKNISLNEEQKSQIKCQLFDSKYSKLEYNKSPIPLKTNDTINNHRQLLDDSNAKFKRPVISNSDVPTPTSLMNDDENDGQETPHLTNLNKENAENIEVELISAIENLNLPVSPSIFYANLNILNADELKQVDYNDKSRLEKFKNIKSKILKETTSRESLNSKLTDLKEQQKILKESLMAASNQDIKKTDDSFTDQAAQDLKEMLKSTQENSPPRLKLGLESLDDSGYEKIHDMEELLSDLAKQLRLLQRRCENPEVTHLFDNNFMASLRSSIMVIERVKDDGKKTNMTQIQLQNRIIDLNIIERKYSQVFEDIEDKVTAKLDQFAKQKEKIEQETLSRKLEHEKHKKEIKEQKQANYLAELNKYDIKFQNIKRFYSSLKSDNLSKKTSVVTSIADVDLLAEANKYSTSIESQIKQISHFIDTDVTRSKSLMASDFSEKQLAEFFKSLKDNLLRFNTIGEDLEKQLKEFGKAIETVLNKKIAKENEIKAAAEAKKLSEEKAKLDLEAKKIEEANQKLAREKEIASEKAKREQAKIDTVNQVKSVNEDDKKGINHLTLTEYENRKAFFAKLQQDAEEPLKDNSLKMYKFDLQKAVNFPLNSMLEDKSNEDNKRNFEEKIKTLLRLLNGYTCTITSTLTVNPTKHPMAIDFCLIYIARKLVEKGEETVGSRPETAFQYSKLIIDILKQSPKFEPIILGQIQEKCPLIVPYYVPRTQNQTDEQYLSSMGYKTTGGKIEDEVHYFKRMSGVLHLYFTLLISTNNSMQSSLGLRSAWQWISDILNLTPRPNITAEMLAIFFKCCGYKMKMYYGRQFDKLVNVCMGDFLELIKTIPQEKQTGAAIGRLESTLEQFKKFNRFPEWKNVN